MSLGVKQGYLWVREEINGRDSNTYVKRYFVAIPFCGLLWIHEYSDAYYPLDINRFVSKNRNLGWVCGGNIILDDIQEFPSLENENSGTGEFWSFSLSVRSGETGCENTLTFFTETKQSRDEWKVYLKKLISTLIFVKSCVEIDFFPFPFLYQAIQGVKAIESLSVHQIPLNSKSLSILSKSLKCDITESLVEIELCDVQLNDRHVSTLNKILEMSSRTLKHLKLSQNLITSNGAKLLTRGLIHCSMLKVLDISSNLIADSSTSSLCEAFTFLPKLETFSIAKNRLTHHSTKSLIVQLGNHNSRLKSLNFSFNEMGDDLGIMVAYLLQNVPAQLEFIDVSFCGLSEYSLKEIVKFLFLCPTLQYLGVQGMFLSPDISRDLFRAVSLHHQKFKKDNNLRLRVRLGGLTIGDMTSSYPARSLRSSCLELSDLTVFHDIILRKLLTRDSSIGVFCCLRLESMLWWKENFVDFVFLLKNGLNLGDEDLRVLSQTVHAHLDSSGHETCYLFLLVRKPEVFCEAAEESCPILRRLNVKSLFLQFADGKVENRLVQSSGFGGEGMVDHFAPAIAPIDQYLNLLREEERGDEIPDEHFWDVNQSLNLLPDLEIRDDLKSAGQLMVDDELSLLDYGDSHGEYQNLVDYENSLREKRLINERMILAIRRLYQSKEVSGKTAKFWEGMFGNKKYRKLTEKELVLAMHRGHERFADSTTKDLGLFHLFPAVAQREQLYQAMYSRDVDEIFRLQSYLPPEIGGYAQLYASRLSTEVVSLRQQFQNLKLLIKTFAELPLVEEFLLNCGKLAYTGPEMFQAVELRNELFTAGISKGGAAFLENIPLVKARSVLTNLMISRDFFALKEKISDWLDAEMFDSSVMPEITVAEAMLHDYDQVLSNLDSATEKQDIEVMDLALSIASYWNFFSSNVEKAIATLNDISRNPAFLMKPIVDGLRKGKMAQVDKGFENLLKMGLVHEALDSVVCSKVHAIKSRLVQDDSVKDKLVKVCLALKNGFHVSPGEIMQLYRKASAIKLHQDPSLRSYFKILQRYSKKYYSLQKQEKLIENLISSNDVHQLSKLLAGRGMGKLIMSFPTAFARDQWLNKLMFVCSGKSIENDPEVLESKDFQEQVVFQGTFEKAARSDDGKLRGWRKRFFLLKSVHLFYYTKLNGEKKGSIRVLNGGVRVLDLKETNGKAYCLELEEGRDLSCVSPDLLEEARRHVRFAKIMEIESSLRKGIAFKSISLLDKMLRFAEELEVMLDYHLMNDAKMSLRSLQIEQLRRDLYLATTTIPRSQQLQELSNLASKFMLDPNLSSLKKVRSLLSKSEIEQEIYRCKSALMSRQRERLMKSLKVLSKIDFTQVSTRLKSVYLTLLLQFITLRSLELVHSGISERNLAKFMKQALVYCHSYHVELEVMDLIRFILKTISKLSLNLGSPLINQSPNASRGKKSLTGLSNSMAMPPDLLTLVEELSLFPKPLLQFSITKFPQLRLTSVQHQSNLFSGFQRRKSSVMDELMSFSSSALVKSLLKYEVNPLDNHIAIETFSILQSLMGDLPASSLKKWKRSKVLQSIPSTGSMVYDLLHLLLKRYPILQDEVYFQLCKQLKHNPSSSSRLKGCWLLSIYLHAFLPSTEAFPYIQNYILQLLVELSQKEEIRSSFDTSEISLPLFPLDPIDKRDNSTHLNESFIIERYTDRLCHSVLQYCYYLINQAEHFEFSSVSPYPLSDALVLQSSFFSQDASFLLRTFEFIFSNQTFPFHVILMTGEVLSLSLHYSQLTIPMLLLHLYEHFFPRALRGLDRERLTDLESAVDLMQGSFLNEFGQDKTSQCEISGFPPSSSPNHKHYHDDGNVWKEIRSLFDGFGFFSLSDQEVIREQEDGSLWIDLMAIPIQPVHRCHQDCSKDLQWAFLTQYLQQMNFSGDSQQSISPHNSLVLRRHVSQSIELFSETDYEIFGEELSETDPIQRTEMWRTWLRAQTSSSSEINLLPRDFARLDLLFSEDTRYVNSRLALLSNESFHYLVALQLSLAWCGSMTDSEEPGIFLHRSSSVGSCYRYYSLDGLVEEAQSKLFSVLKVNQTDASRLEKDQDQDLEGESSASSETDLLAAIDQSTNHPLFLRASLDEDESSDYESSPDLSTVDSEPHWTPRPIFPGQEMRNEEKQFLLKLLDEIGVAYYDPREGEEQHEDQAVDIEQVWSLMAQFHRLPVDLGLRVESYRYRYYMKRAYHHYLVTVTGLFYEQHLIHATLQRLELEESLLNQYIDFQQKVIDRFESLDVLIGMSVQGLYLFSPDDWSIIFFTPFWDLNDFEFSSEDSELVLNVNGLRLVLGGEGLEDVSELLSFFSRETASRGAYPFGTRRAVNELLTMNSYNDQFYAQVKVNSAVSFSAASSTTAQNTNNLQGNQLFQQYLANYSLLPLPPMIDNQAFLRHKNFFLAPQSEREIIANTRYEEEKLEEEIMKLAEQVLLEKNQQQITKGRSDMMQHSSHADEEEELDEEQGPGGEGLDHQKHPSSASNLNRNLKLKRKNRSVFQGNRLKSNEEINQMMATDRLDSVVCGVSNRDSLFTQKYQVPSLPFRMKGKVRIPSTIDSQHSIEQRERADLTSQISLLKELEKKPVVESQRLWTGGRSPHLSLMWSQPETLQVKESNRSKSLIRGPGGGGESDDVEEVWRIFSRDLSRLRHHCEKEESFQRFAEKLDEEDKEEGEEEEESDGQGRQGDVYVSGLSASLWHRHEAALLLRRERSVPTLLEADEIIDHFDLSRDDLAI